MLNITIIGAGIAGLSSSISLRRAGHKVTIYERYRPSPSHPPSGAAITIPGNASRILDSWGISRASLNGVHGTGMIYYDIKTMNIVNRLAFDHLDSMYGVTYWYGHRADLAVALREAACGEGDGTPAVIHEGIQAMSFDPETPSVILSNGETVTADIIISTDGVHSSAPSAIAGYPVIPRPDPRFQMCYRFLIPRDDLVANPMTAAWLKADIGSFCTMEDKENSVRLIVYACRGGSLYNFVVMYHVGELPDADGPGGYPAYCEVPASEVLEVMHQFHPVAKETVKLAKGIRRFPVLCQQHLTSWKRGRMVVAGDAAHAMLPLLGQGAAQAVEDGFVLGLALRNATPATLDARLKVFERLRRQRATAIQIMSRVGIGAEQEAFEEWLRLMPEGEIPKGPLECFEMSHGVDLRGQVEREIGKLGLVAGV